MSIFDNLDANAATAGNPFAFLSQGSEPPPSAPPPAAPEAGQALAGTALGGQPPLAAPDAPAAPQGLLGRLTATTPDGISFNDKLMALGSILKGDSSGAQKYLETRRESYTKTQEAQQKVADAATKQAALQQGAKDLAASTNPDNTINVQKYFQLRAAAGQLPDDKIVSAIYSPNLPKNVVTTGKNGGFDVVRENAPAGVNPLVYEKKGDPPLLPGYRLKADGSGVELIPGVAEGKEQMAAAERAGKPLAPHVGAQNGYLPPPPGLVRRK